MAGQLQTKRARLDQSFSPPAAGLLQRKCACGGRSMTSGECEGCKNKRIELQRKSTNRREASEVPPIVHDVLRSPGQPLDPTTRAVMESRFGQDFSRVRVHSDNLAAQSAQHINASAYTAGQNIVFGSNKYSPHTYQGEILLVHELTHVVQQGKGHLPQKLFLGESNTDEEHQAELNADYSRISNFSANRILSNNSPGIIQRELLAYNDETTEILPSFGGSGSVSSVRRSGDAPNIRTALLPLINSGKVIATDDGQRVFFANRNATQSEIETVLNTGGFRRATEMSQALADDHNVFVYSNDRVFEVSSLFGTYEVDRDSNVIERQTQRNLTDFEKREARSVFGNSLNLDQISLAEDPILSIGGYARTTPWTINFPLGSFSRTNFMPWLIHELTHSWQYQHGILLTTTIYHSIFSSYDYGSEAGLNAATRAGRAFTSFNTEQQGDILQDFYIRTKSGQDVTAWMPYVTEVQATP
ncbi:eCIS core domain-containing protein [Methylomonas sp. MgM2]